MRIPGYLLIIVLFVSCRKAYNPPAIVNNANYLVVEGTINTGSDSTIITLSRTVNIASKSTVNPELNAHVTVEGDQNNSYPLVQTAVGKYASPGLNLDNTHKYRLRINAANGKTYLSDFLEAKTSPPIDSVGFNIASNGVNIYLNTHDPSNNTRYYLWEYTETWMFNTNLDSYFIYSNNEVRLRSANEQIYYCFAGDTTTTLVLNTSIRLKQDVIYQTPITFVASTSEKLEDRYSIIVKQHALTEEAYNYYQLLKKNTQQLGSIFDAVPSELPGNIHEINNAEPVIGYITCGTVSQKRIFIDSRKLPAWTAVTFYTAFGCKNDIIEVSPNDYAYDYGGTNPIYIPTGRPVDGAPAICVDCTLRGTKTPPPFWTY
jgi:hypothetical protein